MISFFITLPDDEAELLLDVIRTAAKQTTHAKTIKAIADKLVAGRTKHAGKCIGCFGLSHRLNCPEYVMPL